MSTIPEPIAGGGGVVGSYQKNFNIAYFASKPPGWQELYNGMAGAPNENKPALDPSARKALLRNLFNAGAKLDPFIEGGDGGVDPFTIHRVRQNQNWAWVERGTGLDVSTDVMGMGNSLPCPPDGIITSTNIADYKPYPIPVPPPVVPVSATKLAHPVGQRITFWSLNGLGDEFRQIVDATGSDGYVAGDIWTGTTAQGYTGQFMKDVQEAGMFVAWKKIS